MSPAPDAALLPPGFGELRLLSPEFSVWGGEDARAACACRLDTAALTCAQIPTLCARRVQQLATTRMCSEFQNPLQQMLPEWFRGPMTLQPSVTTSRPRSQYSMSCSSCIRSLPCAPAMTVVHSSTKLHIR